MASGDHLDPGFHDFIKSVCRRRSLEEEKEFVNHELEQIKESLEKNGVLQDSVYDYLCRLVFCHILGYDVSFGLIYPVMLAMQGSGLEKRIGYTTAMLLLHSDHELSLFLLSSIQMDLNRTNILDNCIALSAVCHLVNSREEYVSMYLSGVQDKLQHPSELVRMKAACCILRFIRTIPSYQGHLQDNIKKLLYDKDPGVMSIGVKIQLELLRGNQNSPNLTSDLIKIQQQLMNRSLPSSFEYHGNPLPWLQIDILRALAVLGRGSKKNSEDMYPLLRNVLDKTDMREKMTYAILYECIVTITNIVPHRELLSEASSKVKKFISSTSYVVKYIGVKALSHLITKSPENCQIILVELQDDPDPAVQSKIAELLHSIAKETDVKIGKKVAEMKNLGSEELLTFNSTSTDWRALSAEESRKGDKSNEVLENNDYKTSTDLLDFSETKIFSEHFDSHETLLSVNNHNKESFPNNKQCMKSLYQEKDFSLEKAGFYSREPPPLSSEDFSEDGMSLLAKQPFSGCDEDMVEGSLMFSQENLESFSQLNLDIPQSKDKESESTCSLFSKTKSNFYSLKSE
ncbi:AP-4 complex subunit epsilon-1-like [Saccostrea echinata]|uniref:AP-4 complex subunit epsilon-1-like n=1 Tax=Saccostrea echinata TaxID=191078 RepID=UPI002A808EAD|nr:AP-4 complex subunit epsilon-1-like [Saccostrea echinata]